MTRSGKECVILNTYCSGDILGVSFFRKSRVSGVVEKWGVGHVGIGVDVSGEWKDP